METYYIIKKPKNVSIPILISCPHSGTEIPHDIKALLNPKVVESLDDTDWFVHNLYDFAVDFGATLIHARFSRLVVDLNRNPSGEKLYTDSRSETQVVPIKTFSGEDVYKGPKPSWDDIQLRIRKYHVPYHQALKDQLHSLRKKYPHVLLFDAHSIKRLVPSIRSQPFPDMILGDQLGRTAHPALSMAAIETLKNHESLDISHNDPFMGGYITRKFGMSGPGIHALQLEMSQDLYMNPEKTKRDSRKEARVVNILASLIRELASKLRSMS